MKDTDGRGLLQREDIREGGQRKGVHRETDLCDAVLLSEVRVKSILWCHRRVTL